MFKATKFLCKSRAVHNKEKREREEKKPPRVDECFGRERDMGERGIYSLFPFCYPKCIIAECYRP